MSSILALLMSHEPNAAQLRAQLCSGHAPSPRELRSLLSAIPASEQDTFLDALLDISGIPEDEAQLPRGCTPYLPCPVSTVLCAIERADIDSSDVFVDVGSGLGRVLVLVQLLTGAECVGLEVQPLLVRRARVQTASLHLSRTTFVEGDTAQTLADVTYGTVFFFYSPFGGERLQHALDVLENCQHPIRVCLVDMPDPQRDWLRHVDSPSPSLAVYRSVRSS